MKIKYPKVITNIGAEHSFRYAVLHALCYRHTPDVDRASYVHMFSIGYWTGIFTTKYGRIHGVHPNKKGVDFVKLVTDETKRLEKELDNE